MKTLKYLPALALLFLFGCSDDGGNPTGGGGGGGLTISVNDVKGLEGSVLTFTVQLNAVAADSVFFNYATANGTAGATDYTTTNGSDTIAPGAASVNIQVSTGDDGSLEVAETFTLTISGVVGASVGKAAGTATIWDNDGVRFATQIKPIIQNAGCIAVGCHGTGSSSGGMTLGAATYNDVINASGSHGKIVVPGNADASNMYLKVTVNPPFGDRMPFGGPYLSDANIALIGNWIDQGAQDN